MSINNDPVINGNFGYFISQSATGRAVEEGLNIRQANEAIIRHNKDTLFEFGEKVSTDLASLKTLKKHTVRTYGMVNENGTRKTGFKWLAQFVNNLFHLSENLERDVSTVLRETITEANKLHTSLNFKFKLSEIKTLPMETVNESIEKMETVLGNVNDVKTNHGDYTNAFERLSTQITDIINQMKHLKLYVTESKILEQLKKNDFSTDNATFQTLGTLAPQDPNGEGVLQSSVNYGEIKTKYDQLCTFKNTCTKLNELQNATTPTEAYGIRSGAKEDFGNTAVTAKPRNCSNNIWMKRTPKKSKQPRRISKLSKRVS